MAKTPTYPTLFDNVLQLHIPKLKEWGYLEPQKTKSGTLYWSSNGKPTGSISIQSDTRTQQPYIELDYLFRGEPRNYKIGLVSIPSNIGRGEIWYFLCPRTNKRCRKLYSVGGYFLHREAFNGCMYDCQTQSKKSREYDKTIGLLFKSQKLDKELYKKHFRNYYAGRPTKKYLRIMKLQHKASTVTYQDFLRLFYGRKT